MEPQVERLAGLVLVAREAMHDAASVPARSKDGERFAPSFPGVNHNWLAALGGKRQLSLEDGALHVARGKVVVVVEANFSDRQHFRVPGQFAEMSERLLGRLGRIVRVDADGGVDERVLISQPNGSLQI